jgi:hypothetical protein
MGGFDSYFQNKQNQQTGQVNNAETSPDHVQVSASQSSAKPNIMAGGENAGQNNGQQGSPYQAGSGFVNLSQLLALNGKGAQADAIAQANKLKQQGQQAQSGIQSAQDKFNQQVAGAQVNSDAVQQQVNGNNTGFRKAQGGSTVNGVTGTQDYNANNLQYVKNVLNKANQGYQGPQDLSSQPGYGALQKQVSDVTNRAKNAQNGGASEAGQIAQDTGLSPRQAAAASFYQGVSNPYLHQAGQRFSNLQNQLDTAEANSVATSDLARQSTVNSASALNDYYNKLQNPGATMPGINNVLNPNANGWTPDGNSQTPADLAGQSLQDQQAIAQGHDPGNPNDPYYDPNYRPTKK